MPQYDMHKELNNFYEQHVRLKQEINRLRELRDTNLNRLTDGLNDLGKPNFVKNLLQGSIAMHTANKAVNNDYDIDIAVIFESDDLPGSPQAAREMVAEAIKQRASGFAQEPEARTNAVTIWYADGYHVDIAVYRRKENWLGIEILEHAGAEWAERNPTSITDWFINTVSNASPSTTLFSTPSVAPQQMRRVVRWVKAFCKAHEGWNLPGGFILSTLVAECYAPHPHRDDVALYNTLAAIKTRLDMSCTIYNPVDSTKELTKQKKFLTQVEKLQKRLPGVINKLNILHDDNCDYLKARSAWNCLFEHTFWSAEIKESVSRSLASNDSNYYVSLKMGVAKSKDGRLIAQDVTSGKFVPKRIHLKFSATTNVAPPYVIRWRAINSGDEAEAQNDMGHISTSNDLNHWEHTAYRGRHELWCELVKDGDILASAKHIVNIR